MRIFAVLALVLLLAAPAVGAEPARQGITEVVAAGPSWETFTNTDGTGLYHEILRAVFNLYGIKVRRIYSTSERAYRLVKSGDADFMTCHDQADPPFILARHPMYAGNYHVFFESKRIGPWQGDESMRGRSIAWRQGYYDSHNLRVPMEIHEYLTGVDALVAVVRGSVDFYMDDVAFIKESIKNSRVDFDRARFDIQPAGYRTYRPMFLMSERGDAVRELYDRGMETLHRQGRLEPIFRKWGYPYPQYDMAQ